MGPRSPAAARRAGEHPREMVPAPAKLVRRQRSYTIDDEPCLSTEMWEISCGVTVFLAIELALPPAKEPGAAFGLAVGVHASVPMAIQGQVQCE